MRGSDNWRTGLHLVIYLELNKSWSSICRFLMRIILIGDKTVVSLVTGPLQTRQLSKVSLVQHPTLLQPNTNTGRPYWGPCNTQATYSQTIFRSFYMLEKIAQCPEKKGENNNIKSLFVQPSSRLV